MDVKLDDKLLKEAIALAVLKSMGKESSARRCWEPAKKGPA